MHTQSYCAHMHVPMYTHTYASVHPYTPTHTHTHIPPHPLIPPYIHILTYTVSHIYNLCYVLYLYRCCSRLPAHRCQLDLGHLSGGKTVYNKVRSRMTVNPWIPASGSGLGSTYGISPLVHSHSLCNCTYPYKVRFRVTRGACSLWISVGASGLGLTNSILFLAQSQIPHVHVHTYVQPPVSKVHPHTSNVPPISHSHLPNLHTSHKHVHTYASHIHTYTQPHLTHMSTYVTLYRKIRHNAAPNFFSFFLPAESMIPEDRILQVREQ